MEPDRQPAGSPYTRFEPSELILRDELALDRTILANERTYLAYVRAAIALILAGVTFVHFSDALWYTLIGAACIPLGVAGLLIGVIRYRRMQSALAPFRSTRRLEP